MQIRTIGKRTRDFMHEGHRKRMYEKLANGDNLYEHEVLEILLFNALPRKNTNPIAHELLKRFGSITGVLNANADELTSIDGIGENAAYYLKCVGECLKRTPDKENSIAVIKTRGDVLNFVKMRMRGKPTEELEIYFLSKTGAIKRIFNYTSYHEHKVTVTTDKLSQDIAAGKPASIIVAHNHLSGDSTPSVSDDHFTKLVQLICSLNNVNFFDHCIYASDTNVYSYYESGKIEEIQRNFSMHSLIRALDEDRKN